MPGFPYFEKFSDEDYFADAPMDDLEFALLDHPDKSVVVLAGPRTWDLQRHGDFRAVSCFKNPPDFAPPFQPHRRSSKILVDLATGESSVESFAKPAKTFSPAPSDPGQVQGPNVERKDILLSAARFARSSDAMRLFVYSGKLLSNPLDFRIVNRNPPSTPPQLPPAYTQPLAPWEVSTERFGALQGAPIPKAPGISVAQGSTALAIDGQIHRIPLTITFLLDGQIPEEQLRIPVRLLFGSDANAANRDLEVLIPKARMTRAEAGLVGHYTLDLAPLLVDSSTGKTVQPQEWYLTAICKGVYAGPTPLTVPVR